MYKPSIRYRLLLLLTLCLLATQAVLARDVMRYKRYTVQDGLSHRLISGFMQDSIGNIWLSTWNGLCKFDGETFTTYNETAGHEKIGRLGLVRLTTQGKVWIIRQSDMQEYLLNQTTGLLEPVKKGSIKLLPVPRPDDDVHPEKSGLILMHDSIRYSVPYEGAGMTGSSHFIYFIDRQQNVWANYDDALYQVTFDKATYEHIEQVDPHHNAEARFGDEIRAMLQLHDGGFLLGCKNAYIYKYNADWQFEGYLSPEGKVVREKTAFGARAYSMKQASDGSVWIGSRGNGLFYVSSPQLDKEIREAGKKPCVHNFREPLVSENIFDVEFASDQRLIVATWSGGVKLLNIDASGNATLAASNDSILKVRHITTIHPNLFALCSTQGIFFVDKDLKELKRLGTMDFSDLTLGAKDTYYASSLPGSIYTFHLSMKPSQKELDSLQVHVLNVKEIDNIVLSIAKTSDQSLWFISDNKLIRYNQKDGTTQVIDRTAIGSDVIFGEAVPLTLNDELILGTTVGRMKIDLQTPTGYCPQLRLNTSDTLSIQWGEDVPEIRATALDFRLPRLIQYAWRELPDSTWTNLGNTGILSPDMLWPGVHQFEIRSTDAKGLWADNARTITIIVSLALWQKIALGILLLLILGFVYWTWRVNKKMHQPLPPKVSVISGIQPTQPIVIARDQQFIEQVTKIVEEHIDDPMLDVEMMTAEMNTSRTILYAKFKELLDTTPASFITEIRLKRAIQLLGTHQYRVNEVAQMCGFSDPKYFTRHFKQRMGISPAKYLESEK